MAVNIFFIPPKRFKAILFYRVSYWISTYSSGEVGELEVSRALGDALGGAMSDLPRLLFDPGVFRLASQK